MRFPFTVTLAVLTSFAGGITGIDPVPARDATLQYDDGTAQWLTWSGIYRGVWFNTGDFLPGSNGFLLEESVLWISDPVDCYVEVWNGGASGPAQLLDQTLVTGGSMSVVYSPPLDCDSDFWILMNTSIWGGVPRIMGDASPPPVDHSFYSDDFLTWEPWSDGSTTGDYLIRGLGEFKVGLGSTTWGSIKSLF